MKTMNYRQIRKAKIAALMVILLHFPLAVLATLADTVGVLQIETIIPEADRDHGGMPLQLRKEGRSAGDFSLSRQAHPCAYP